MLSNYTLLRTDPNLHNFCANFQDGIPSDGLRRNTTSHIPSASIPSSHAIPLYCPGHHKNVQLQERHLLPAHKWWKDPLDRPACFLDLPIADCGRFPFNTHHLS